jgi:hypothetical protein
MEGNGRASPEHQRMGLELNVKVGPWDLRMAAYFSVLPYRYFQKFALLAYRRGDSIETITNDIIVNTGFNFL